MKKGKAAGIDGITVSSTNMSCFYFLQ